MAPDSGRADDRQDRRAASRTPEGRNPTLNTMADATADSDALLITADGFEQLRSELALLRTNGRREVSERLRDARADGELADNPALWELLEEQAQMERRIAILEEQIAATRIVEPAGNGVACIGSSVRVRDVALGVIAEYHLVGAIESDIENSRVSVSAPVGRALVGCEAGETVHVQTPRGARAFQVLAVRPCTEPRHAASKAA
jgi:transcription elongation factor GreA